MNYSEVRDRVEAFMADQASWTNHTQVVIRLSSELHIEMTSEKYVGLTGEAKTFDGQVRRALKDLTDRRVLVRRKRSGPGYGRGRAEVDYLHARQAEVLEWQRKEDAAAEERQRKADQELIDGFAKLGFTEVGVSKGHQLTMTRTAAGRILNMLEAHHGERARPGPTCPHGNISRVTCNEC